MGDQSSMSGQDRETQHIRAEADDCCAVASIEGGSGMGERFNAPSESRKLLQATIRALGGPIFVIDRARRLTAATDSAKAMLKTGGVLVQTRFGGVRAVAAKDARRLEAALTEILDTECSGNSKLIWLGAPQSAARLLVRVASIVATERLALIVVRDLKPQPPNPALIAECFGLSIAEARLAGALASGRTIVEYAIETGASRNTIRNQLASLFAKTGARRQAELVGLMVRAFAELQGDQKDSVRQ